MQLRNSIIIIIIINTIIESLKLLHFPNKLIINKLYYILYMQPDAGEPLYCGPTDRTTGTAQRRLRIYINYY